MVNRLDERDRKKIVKLIKQRITHKNIADRFGVSQATISATMKKYLQQKTDRPDA